MKPSQIVEAVLFASDAPMRAEEIARADEALDEDQVELAIRELKNEYAETGRAFQVVEVGEGYQLLTLTEFAPYLERLDTVPRPSRLSHPALETLAIIAYRQPIGRLEIEYVRGVSSAGVIRTLQDRQLIDIVGRAEAIGRPLLYGTTPRFLEHFGFRNLGDLPAPAELNVVLRERTPLGIVLEEEVGSSEPDLERQGQVVLSLEDGGAAGDASVAVEAEADGGASDVPMSEGAAEADASEIESAVAVAEPPNDEADVEEGMEGA